jgi:DNA invertase Pin-like site-specific DNA recombinase
MTASRMIVYVRVSSAEQASSGHSLNVQEAKLRAYATAMDLDVISVEVDAGYSAGTMNRPGLQRALAALKAGKADGLLITKLDRLTRSVRDLADLLEYFADCSLISLGDSVDTRSASGKLVLNLLTSVAEWERASAGERTRAVKQAQKARNEYVGGGVPFGWRLASDGETLVERADEQAVITRARELRAAGQTIRAIAAHLGQPVGRVQRVLAA